MSRSKSISMKLLELSKKLGINNQLILIRFFHERLLYRVSVSKYNKALCLKGGNLLYSIQGNKARPTIDIDFSGQSLSNDLEAIRLIFIKILSQEVDDAVFFDCNNLKLIRINEQNQYFGIRIKVPASLGNIKHIVQIDLGYGDVITHEPILIKYPVILSEFENPVLNAYNIETVIAEKLHAILALAHLNSRMKDFYDIYNLLKTQSVDSHILREAIANTFLNRKTEITSDSIAFLSYLSLDENKNKMWDAYLRKLDVTDIEFKGVVEVIINLINSVSVANS